MVSERAVPKVAITVFGHAETLIFLEGCCAQVLIEHVFPPPVVWEHLAALGWGDSGLWLQGTALFW